MAKDVTVAEALRTLGLGEARWQAVLESAQDAIISIDRSGTVTLFNRAAERIFGYAADEVMGRNLTMLMPSPYREEHHEYVERYEHTGVAQAIGRVREVHGQRKDGQIFPIELSVSEGRFGEERVYTAIIRDVSERVRIQSELHDLERLSRQRERLADIGAITARVVHDLGNPLAAISMQAQLLMRRLGRGGLDQNQLMPTAEQIIGGVERLDALVQEFSGFAREQRLELTDVVMPDFLRDLRDLWFPLASSRQIDLELDVVACPLVRADPNKLSRVIENLVKNAIEAVERGPGRVILGAGELRNADRVRVSIADTGPGLSPAIKPFELFETTKRNGTGLGLAIAKQIVVAHGGNIHHEPRQPHGSVFHVDLPTVRRDDRCTDR